MKYREFEKSIGEKLYREEAEIDIAALIESIHKDKGGRKVLPIIWLSLASLGLLAFLFASYNTQSNKNSFSTSTTLNSTSIKTSSLSSDLNNSTRSDANPTPISTILTNKIQRSLNNLTSNFSSNSKNGSSKKISEKNYSKISIITNNPNTAIKSNDIVKFNSLTKDAGISEKNQIDHTTLNDNMSNSSFNILLQSDEDVIKYNTKDQSQVEQRDFTNTLSLLYTIPSFINFTQNKLFIPKDKIVECPRFSSKRKLVFSLIPEIGYFQPMKTLTSKIPESSALLNLRRENEKSLDGFQAALYVQAKHTKFPVYVRTGLQLTNQTEKMTLNYSSIKRDTTQGVVSIITSQTGDTITYIYGNIIKETQIKGTKIAHYSLTSIDLPISVGVTKYIGNFNVGAELGATINLSLTSEGRIAESTDNFTSIKSTNNPFVNKVGLGYFGSLFIEREIFTHNSIYLSLRGRMLPKSFSIESSDYSQRYNSIGLHIGYKVDF